MPKKMWKINQNKWEIRVLNRLTNTNRYKKKKNNLSIWNENITLSRREETLDCLLH